jgi:hypothetical protein
MVRRFPARPLATNVEYHHIDPGIIKPSDTHLEIREFELSCPCKPGRAGYPKVQTQYLKT